MLLAKIPGTLHATAVSFGGKGLLIIGPSGSGKSNLALQLMALGADLIVDDLVEVYEQEGGPWLRHPLPMGAKTNIEARGLGILPAKRAEPAPLAMIVDLAQVSQIRLPDPMFLRIGNFDVSCFHKVDTPAFPAMVQQYLIGVSTR